MSEFLANCGGRHAVVGLRENEGLEVCGIDTRLCVAKIAGADGLGLWLENPAWGWPHLGRPRKGYVLVRWSLIETLILFPEDPFSDDELRCLAQAPEQYRAIGFRPEAAE